MDIWNSNFYQQSCFFESLLTHYPWQSFNHWPQLQDFNNLLNNKVVTASNKRLHCVPPSSYQYELQIYEQGELQTREQNWHDFFNLLVWATFPKTKARLNYHQYHALSQRLPSNKQRTHIENLLAHFDENGVIVLSANPQLTQLLLNFSWKELFWHNREAIKTQMRFFVFGHGLYNKLLDPYIGLTGSAIILEVKEHLLTNDLTHQINNCDLILTQFLSDSNWLTNTKKLTPLPLLGVPDYWPNNNKETFYDNTQYFRSKLNLS